MKDNWFSKPALDLLPQEREAINYFLVEQRSAKHLLTMLINKIQLRRARKRLLDLRASHTKLTHQFVSIKMLQECKVLEQILNEMRELFLSVDKDDAKLEAIIDRLQDTLDTLNKP